MDVDPNGTLFVNVAGDLGIPDSQVGATTQLDDGHVLRIHILLQVRPHLNGGIKISRLSNGGQIVLDALVFAPTGPSGRQEQVQVG